MVWALLTRVYGKFAVSLADYVAKNTGVELRNPGGYARNLKPRWVNATYPTDVESDVQCIGKGWQWLQEAVITIQGLYAKPESLAQCSEEIDSFVTCP